MKLVKILAITLLALPFSASARGFLVPVIPTASITVGGQQAFTVTTGEKIPVIRWKSVNGTDFKTTLSVNNPALCGGIKDNQPWGQGRTASGNFDLGIAPKAREGCILTFAYEVKSRTGHQRVDRAVLRYVAPRTNTTVPATNTGGSTNPTNPTNPKPEKDPVVDVQVINTNASTEVVDGKETAVFEVNLKMKSDQSIAIDDDLSTNINFWNERPFGFVGITTLKDDVNTQSQGDVNFTLYSKDFEKTDAGKAESAKWILRPSQSGVMTLRVEYSPQYEDEYVFELAGLAYKTYNQNSLGSKTYQKRLMVRTDGVFVNFEDDNTPLSITTEFIDRGSITNNDDGSSVSYNLGFKIVSTKDIFISSKTNNQKYTESDSGLVYKIDGPAGAAYSITASNYVGGKESYRNINGVQYFRIPKNTETEFVTNLTISDVSVSGQYRAELIGFNYLTSPNGTSTWQSFVNYPEETPYRSAYRTINSNGFFSSIFEKINSLGSSLGSVVSGAVRVFQFF